VAGKLAVGAPGRLTDPWLPGIDGFPLRTQPGNGHGSSLGAPPTEAGLGPGSERVVMSPSLKQREDLLVESGI
jgi:hypothetical protein